MGEKTKISWTEKSLNLWIGCQKGQPRVFALLCGGLGQDPRW
jgi:hypothetical protein